nr:MAG TPA: hypothetical protein [Caudoviricetes sp.]
MLWSASFFASGFGRINNPSLVTLSPLQIHFSIVSYSAPASPLGLLKSAG